MRPAVASASRRRNARDAKDWLEGGAVSPRAVGDGSFIGEAPFKAEPGEDAAEAAVLAAPLDEHKTVDACDLLRTGDKGSAFTATSGPDPGSPAMRPATRCATAATSCEARTAARGEAVSAAAWTSLKNATKPAAKSVSSVLYGSVVALAAINGRN